MVNWLVGISDLSFLPIAIRGVHSVDLTTISLHIMAKELGWLTCMSSSRASLKTLWMAIFLLCKDIRSENEGSYSMNECKDLSLLAAPRYW